MVIVLVDSSHHTTHLFMEFIGLFTPTNKSPVTVTLNFLSFLGICKCFLVLKCLMFLDKCECLSLLCKVQFIVIIRQFTVGPIPWHFTTLSLATVTITAGHLDGLNVETIGRFLCKMLKYSKN